jgi:hypothetical protein
MGSCGLVAIAEAQATTGAGARSTNWPNADVRAGMIFMPGTYRRAKNDIGRIVAVLEAKLGQYPDEEDLVNAEEWP